MYSGVQDKYKCMEIPCKADMLPINSILTVEQSNKEKVSFALEEQGIVLTDIFDLCCLINK